MPSALSSLLNLGSNADDAMADENPATTPSPHASRRESATSVNQLLSPELAHAQLPKYTPPQRPRPGSSGSGDANTTQQHGILDSSSTATNPIRHSSSTEQNGGAATLPAYVSPTAERQEEASDVSGTKHALGFTDGQPHASLSLQDGGVHGSHGESEAGREGQMVPRAAHVQDSEGPVLKIKQEIEPSPQPASPLDARRSSIHSAELEHNSLRNLTSLKQEHISRTQSPLRESSVAVPSTEHQYPAPAANMKKKPAPSKAKKGTATTAKKTKGAVKKKKAEPKSAKVARNGTSFSPAPTDGRSFSAELDDDDDDDESAADSNDDVEGSGDVYCICRKPDNGTFMIGCDGRCDDWFHGKCVGIEERDKTLMSNYFCPSCTAAGVGRTSWKRMCRRPGCRRPARVGRNAHKDGSTSKYCSDECGVLFFRDMTSRARGAEQVKKNTRRKSGTDSDAVDVGLARGGVLSVGEIKTLIDRSNTTTDFKAIGNGVLSPPPTPTEAEPSAFTEAETSELENITAKKDATRQRHRILKDRLAFIGFVKNEATRAAAEKDLKPKEYCGFDTRINWSEEEFDEWRQSPTGEAAFERESVEQMTNGTTDYTAGQDATMLDEANEPNELEVCIRKKCARHAEWAKLAVDELRFEMTENSDRMRHLAQQERDIRQRASLRAKHPGLEDGGTVEWHSGGHVVGHVNGTDAMDVDVA